jgi:cell division protein FtsL
LALALVGFLLVTTGVIWRRSFGISESRVLRDLDRQRVELEAEKARLESEVREAASRARLAPIAEQRLRLHVPNDSQVVILQSPPRRTNGTP